MATPFALLTATLILALQDASDLRDWLGFDPPISARADVLETLWLDARAERSPSDGGGSFRLLSGAEDLVAATSARLEFEYVAGPLGIEPGGALYLQAPPFWGWSTPQTAAGEGLGFTTVGCDARGVELVPETIDQQLLSIRVEGRALREGERVHIVYGAGESGARVDRYAERAARFHLAVDGDGDGIRAVLDDEAAVQIGPGPPVRLLLFVPATARPGEDCTARLALVDRVGNRSPVDRDLKVVVTLEEGAEPVEVAIPAGADHASVDFAAGDGGTRRLSARIEDEDGRELFVADSNPMRVSGARRVLWADLQGHSSLSDGTGEPEDHYAYAREIAALDVVALTDHDHWGMRPLDDHPALWQSILDAADAADAPGEFLALTGFEWTSWLFGHRHVLHFGDERPLLSSFDRAYDTPQELWNALAGTSSISLPHTLAGGPVAVDWSSAPPAEVESVVELVSVHGASDAPDSPRRIYSPREGHWFTDVLGRGYRYGVLGSTDGHDGHPGLAHLAAPTGGVAGILAETPTREAVLEAIRARRTFATSGPRILVRTNLAGRPMGAALPAADLPEEPSMFLEVFGTDEITRIDLLDRYGFLASLEVGGVTDVRTSLPIPKAEPGGLIWLRIVQADGHAAWTSPYFFD